MRGIKVLPIRSVIAGFTALVALSAAGAVAAPPVGEPGADILVDPKPVDRGLNRPVAAAQMPQPQTTLPQTTLPETTRPQTAPVPSGRTEAALSVDMIAAETPALPIASPDTVPVNATQSDGVYEERLALARRLLEVDGTEAIIRHFVSEVHMRLIVAEVGKYVDLNALSESDRYRLATIVATTATELGDKIVMINARAHAQNLSQAELVDLARANDTDAQRKLTQMRIDDTGALDKNAALIMQISALKIVQEYEKP